MCRDAAKTVLRFIDADIRARPGRVRPLDPDLLERARRLVEGVETTMERSEPGDAQPPAPHHP